RLVLVRHGQSEWNVTDPTRNLTARFTGWADIGLTQQGKDQAIAAGKAIELARLTTIRVPAIDVAFCSLLRRATDTMNLILNESKRNTNTTQYTYNIPIVQSWRLNERHYGALVGLSKSGAERLYGKVRLTRWRDSWDVPPPPMPVEMVKKWGNDDSSATSSSSFMPPSESLRDTFERFLPLWIQGIAPHLRSGRTVLVVGHANTIRSMLFAIDGEVINKENAKSIKVPSALPLVYEFVD
ncbi:hypothetical protein THAPSDRAFT_263035, partial [Thalassiosira pseudonana CCMP1335]